MLGKSLGANDAKVSAKNIGGKKPGSDLQNAHEQLDVGRLLAFLK